MTAPKLDALIRKHLEGRKDIWLDDAVSADDGCPEIRGVKLRRVKETEVRGPDSYHPFTYTGWYYFGQAFAVETEMLKGQKPLSKSQILWRDNFEAAGGTYIEAWNIECVFGVLGKQRPEPWSEYETRQTRIGRGS